MKNKIVDMLLGKPIGQIIACNLLTSLDEKLISLSTVKEFFQNCFDAFLEEPVNTVEELIGQFEDVARGDRPIGTGSKKRFLFVCSKKAASIKHKEYSTITNIGTLTEYLVQDSSLADGHVSFMSNPDPTDPMLKEAVEKLNGRADIFRTDARLGGNPFRPLFWIAPTEMLSKSLPPASEHGDYYRDLLGLIHYKDNVPLVEICFPGDKLHRHKHCRPTFADAGSHRRFKVSPDGKSARRRSSWGHTVDLKRFAVGERIIDGVAERVAAPITFDPGLNARINFAGITKTIMGISNDDDQEFLKRLPYSSNSSALRVKLLRLFT